MAGVRGGTSKSTLAAIAAGYPSVRAQRNATAQSRGFESYSQQTRLGYHREKRGDRIVETFHIKGTAKQRENAYREAQTIIRNKGGKTQIKILTDQGWRSVKTVRSNEVGDIYQQYNDFLATGEKYKKSQKEIEADQAEPEDDEEDEEQGELFLAQFDE